MAPINPEVKAGAEQKVVATANVDDELEKEYVEKKTVTISLVHNYSNYRVVNSKALEAKKEIIGSSISSCRTLSSNRGEVEAYFPSIIGLSVNNPEFVSRVKAWLSNIQFIVTESDSSLDVSFVWKRKADYLDFQKKEEAIEEEYAKIDRANIKLIKEGIKRKINALNALESEKYKYGYPSNVEHYIIYRHCLLYKDVAKDIALINSDPSLRFYIKDDNKEAEKQKRLTQEKMKAMSNFIELNASPAKFNAVYIAMTVSRNESVAEALNRANNERMNILMDFVNTSPDKFNRLYNDKFIITKALIETLIVRGELIRAEFNQQISTPDGTFIGSNINEAVAWFENPNNKEAVDVLKKKLDVF